MILRGLLVALAGFLFIFSPGLPMRLLMQRGLSFQRDMVYWGIGAWLLALLPSLFLQSLLRQIVQASRPGGPAPEYGLALAGACLTALLVAGMTALVLRFRSRGAPPAELPGNGLAIGFGVGLVAQVFTGLSLVGAGVRLIYGDTSTATLAGLAQAGVLNLSLALLAVILYRPALLAVSAVRGLLVARSLAGQARFFWLGVLVDALFGWLILALQLWLGNDSPGDLLAGGQSPLVSLVTIVYYLLALGLAYRWLTAQIARSASGKVSSQ